MKTLISFHFGEMIALSSVGIPTPPPPQKKKKSCNFDVIGNESMKSKNWLFILCKIETQKSLSMYYWWHQCMQ